MGLDTSSLKIFIKNYKNFLKINEQSIEQLSLDEKLNLVQKFLEDKKVFPTIKDVITFAMINWVLILKTKRSLET